MNANERIYNLMNAIYKEAFKSDKFTIIKITKMTDARLMIEHRHGYVDIGGTMKNTFNMHTINSNVWYNQLAEKPTIDNIEEWFNQFTGWSQLWSKKQIQSALTELGPEGA